MHEVAEELDPYLSQLSLGQLEDLYASIANYKEKPVCIEEFLDSDKYLGAYWNGDLYGYWRNFLKEVYPSPFFSPYWLISLRGSIGQGKCLDSDTRVPTSLGIKCIKDLYALWSSGSRFQVLSESGPKEVSFMVSDGIKPCRTISTIKGAKVTVGDNHRFRVLHPTTGAILWKKASDLCQGDKILRTLRPSPVGNKVLLPNFAWFVGAISGDGGISVLKNGDRVVIHFIMNAVDIKDDNYRESIEKGFSEFAGGFNNWYLSRNCFATRKVSRSLASYLLSQGFLGKEQNEGGRLPKLVPEFIFEASAADQVEYIAGVVDTDGHLSTHMAAIEISNSSECFIRGLASICSALGLLVRVTPKHFVNREHVYWRLSIHNYRSFRRLAELNFRPRLVYKQQAFAELLASKDSGSNVRLPLVGFSPILRQLDQRLRESGVKTQARNVRSVWGMVSNQTTTLDSVQRIASTFKTGGLVRDFDFVNDFQCYTDEVRSIETVNREVYDLSVADDPSYVFDGFISHNTSVACAGLAYDIYKLILMNAPQESFGLVRSTKILFAIFNRTLSLTTDVVWDKLSQMFVQSPFFYQFVGVFGSKKKRSFGSDDTLFPNRVDFIMGSRMGHALGQAIHCLTGDTKIQLLNGESVPIQELVGRDHFWLYSSDKNGHVIPGRGHSARITGYVDRLYEVELDNGKTIRCTNNHPFMMRDGSYVTADQLKPNNSLMPLYFGKKSGQWDRYSAVVDNTTGKVELVHRLVVRECLGGYKGSQVAHHIDYNSRNNDPSNLMLMSPVDHKHLHSDRWQDPEYRSRMKVSQSKGGKAAAEILRSNPVTKAKLSKAGKSVWTEEFAERKSREFSATLTEKWKDPKFRADLRPHQVEFGKKAAAATWSNPDNKEKISKASSKTAKIVNARRWSDPAQRESLLEMSRAGGRAAAKVVWSNPNTVKIIKEGAAAGGAKSANKIVNWTCPQCSRLFEKQVSANNHKRHCLNHKVVSVRMVELAEKVPVYDITVDEFHNFAVEQGVFLHNSAIISEANFEVIEGQTYKTFNSVLRRMESRFIGSDGIPGKIWIDSSETDKFSAVNKIVDSYRRSQGVKVSQAAVWDVKPHRYGTARFWVFKGSDVKQPELLQLDSPILISEPENCIQVPTEHKDAFEADTVEALRDLAGIATGSKYRLFRLKDRLTKAIAVSPLFPDKFQLDFDDDNDQISNYCLVKNYFLNPLNKGYPRNIHLDIGLSGDRLGIAGSYVTKFRDRIYRDISTFQEVSESVPEVVCEWCIGIEPKNGKQVPLFKIRAFIQWLSSVGYPVGRITSDGFQSAEMIQLLTKMGFTAELLSMDKTSTPYTEVRNALYEGRVMVPQNKLLKEELENLEVTPDGTKVDHQPDGSKDLADAACGSIYTAMIDASKIRLMHYVEKKQSVGTENLQNMFWNEG
jgi:intein/homing endonuclease